MVVSIKKLTIDKRLDHWENKLNFSKLEEKHQLPKGLLREIVDQESDGLTNTGSKAGAYGLFQFMRGTASDYGVNRSNPLSSAKGAAKYLGKFYTMYDGDIDKALAAYNWGSGHLRKAIRRYGDDWLAHAPRETRDYVVQVKERLELRNLQHQLNDVECHGDIHCALANNATIVTAVQTKLAKLGYRVGEATGVFDETTQEALAAFEQTMKKHKVQASKRDDFMVDGQLDFASVSQLVLSENTKKNASSLKAPKGLYV